MYLKKPKTYTYILVYHEKITSIHSELAGEVKSNAVALAIRVVSVLRCAYVPTERETITGWANQALFAPLLIV